jgi:hypothetical protein
MTKESRAVKELQGNHYGQRTSLASAGTPNRPADLFGRRRRMLPRQLPDALEGGQATLRRAVTNYLVRRRFWPNALVVPPPPRCAGTRRLGSLLAPHGTCRTRVNRTRDPEVISREHITSFFKMGHPKY